MKYLTFKQIFWSHHRPLGVENILNLIKYLLLGITKQQSDSKCTFRTPVIVCRLKKTGIKSRKNKTKRKQSPRVVNCFVAAEKLLGGGGDPVLCIVKFKWTHFFVQSNSNVSSKKFPRDGTKEVFKCHITTPQI